MLYTFHDVCKKPPELQLRGFHFRLTKKALSVCFADSSPKGRAKSHTILIVIQSIKTEGVYLGFYTLRGRKFPLGNFRTFCVPQRRNTLLKSRLFSSNLASPAGRGGAAQAVTERAFILAPPLHKGAIMKFKK